MTSDAARGDVWWCETPEIGRRPVVILSRALAISALRRAIIAPCTTHVRGLATEVVLEPQEDPVPARCAVSLDSVDNVPVSLLVTRLGRLGDMRMQEICAALALAVDCRK